MENTHTTLLPNEPHPAAQEALRYIYSKSMEEQLKWLEAFSSCAIEGNRLGEICAETLRRVIHRVPVSDRYVLGLAYTMRNWQD